jgi:hypothetical protein
MRDVIIQRGNIEVGALDAEVRAALGEAVTGISAYGDQVIVHLQDEFATPQRIAQAQQIVAAHVPPAPKAPEPSLEERLAALEARLKAFEAK